MKKIKTPQQYYAECIEKEGTIGVMQFSKKYAEYYHEALLEEKAKEKDDEFNKGFESAEVNELIIEDDVPVAYLEDEEGDFFKVTFSIDGEITIWPINNQYLILSTDHLTLIDTLFEEVHQYYLSYNKQL